MKKNQMIHQGMVLYAEPKEAAACAAAFLKRHGMHPEQTDAVTELKKFMEEMETVRKGGKGSVKMIPSRVGVYHPPCTPVTLAVLDIGGSHVRCAVVNADQNGITGIHHPVAFPTPGITAPVDTETFFGTIVRNTREYLCADHIGICFSLATIPAGDRDAVMVAGGKQLQITDMMGKKVGESFRLAMERQGLSVSAPVTVINDTVAAALARQALVSAGSFGSFIGFIYGTGTNVCYRENNALINVESGAYCGFPAGDLDDLYDSSMIDRGRDRFEKMVSGGYQGGLARIVLHSAASEGMISGETYRSLFPEADTRLLPGEARSAGLSSADLSRFCADPSGSNLIAGACHSEFERRFLAAVFDMLTQRSARLCAITITGAMLRSEKNRPCPAPPDAEGRPFSITAEGSTYLKQKGFKEMLDEELSSLAADRFGLSYEIGTVSDAVIKGLAAACLSN